jgi:aryl-alcohol dehydrogenase-like predicted oxidoreductase
MRQLPLGQSGINASVVGLGTWGMGGWMWGGVDYDEAVRAVRHALDVGINLVDTAPIYGFGLSEEIVGEAIRDRRDDVVLATKCGMVANTKKGELKFRADVTGAKPHGHIAVYIYLHPDSIRDEVEASLTRLQTDYIDLYQTHWQEVTTPIEDTMAVLMKLRDEGKIRAIGVSNASSEQMEQYRKVGRLDSDQELYSMLDRRIEQDQLPYCAGHHIAMLAYSPLAKGLLTGKIGPDVEFSHDDLRRNEKRFDPENRKRVQNMLEAMQPVAETHDLTTSQLVVAWTLHQPGVTHVLCGSRRGKHVEENAAAGDVQLTKDEVRLMNEAIDDYMSAAV